MTIVCRKCKQPGHLTVKCPTVPQPDADLPTPGLGRGAGRSAGHRNPGHGYVPPFLRQQQAPLPSPPRAGRVGNQGDQGQNRGRAPPHSEEEPFEVDAGELSGSEVGEECELVRALEWRPRQADDVQSLVESLASGTTRFTNAVQEVVGHAATRDIGKQLTQETLQKGIRLLTHASNGGDSRDKPFRWMALHQWKTCEVLGGRGDPDSIVWHTVVYELDPTKAGKAIVVTQFFAENMAVFYQVIRDELQILHEDDPRLLQTLLRKPGFKELLKRFFEVGDQQDLRFQKVLARQDIWEEGCLLNLCCERGLAECVRFLLGGYAEGQFPAEEPWLRLADPMWASRAFGGNTAFHSAAWRGQAAVMRTLLVWAKERGKLQQARQLQNQKGQTPEDVLLRRIESFERSRRDPANFRATLRVLQGFFAPEGSQEEVKLLSSPLEQRPYAWVEDLEGQREGVELPEALSLRQLQELVRDKWGAVLGHHRAATLMVQRAQFVANQDDDAAAEDFFDVCSSCPRIVFRCFSGWTTCAAMITAVARAISSRPQDLAWRSLDCFPTPVESDGGCQAANAASLRGLVQALQRSCGQLRLIDLSLPSGFRTCLPASESHLTTLVGTMLSIRSAVDEVLSERWQTGESRLQQKLARNFRSHNPLLRGVAAIERRLLDRTRLIASAKVAECLHPGLAEFLRVFAESLVAHVRTLPDWAPRVASRPLGDGDYEKLQLVQRMADEALLMLFKMRPGGGRPGLPVLRHALPALECVGHSGQFEESRRYIRHLEGRDLPAADEEGTVPVEA